MAIPLLQTERTAPLEKVHRLINKRIRCNIQVAGPTVTYSCEAILIPRTRSEAALILIKRSICSKTDWRETVEHIDEMLNGKLIPQITQSPSPPLLAWTG